MLKTPYYDNKFSLYCNVEFYLKSTKNFNWLCSFKHLATLVQKIRSFAGIRYGAKQKPTLKRVPPELICKDGFSVHLTFCDYNNSTLKVVSCIRAVFVI